MKKLLIVILVILTVAAGAFGLWLEFGVTGPDQVVEDFVEAFDDMDYNGIVECLDPESQVALKAMSGLTGLFTELIFEVDIDPDVMFGLLPMLAEYEGVEIPTLDVEVVDVEYSGEEYEKFMELCPIKIPVVGKLMADEAVVRVVMSINDEPSNDYFVLKQYGSKGWRIDGQHVYDF